ncbi:MAG: carboxymuconolactone decarboxylase family protein [Actinobacteria bacterium]|nr:carboxymuconolactone decarboxylase family protein [Actinomycetota bacterium]
MTWIEHGSQGGSLPNILASHSLNPEALKGHLALYRAVMFGESPLSRAQREAIAVVVSAANDCHY